MERISEYLLTFIVNAAWQIPAVAAIASLMSLLLRNARHDTGTSCGSLR